jgi:hypothetical protein
MPDATPDQLRQAIRSLRDEAAAGRVASKRSDDLGRRLHSELVRASGRLADPSDLQFDPAHLDDPDALSAAVDDLLTRRPHYASRRPTGDVGQGVRGDGGSPAVGLADLLRGAL